MSFAQIEDVIGGPLPLSSRTLRNWWQNTYSSKRRHVQAIYGWYVAGWDVETVGSIWQTVVFRKQIQRIPPSSVADLTVSPHFDNRMSTPAVQVCRFTFVWAHAHPVIFLKHPSNHLIFLYLQSICFSVPLFRLDFGHLLLNVVEQPVSDAGLSSHSSNGALGACGNTQRPRCRTTPRYFSARLSAACTQETRQTPEWPKSSCVKLLVLDVGRKLQRILDEVGEGIRAIPSE